MTEGRTEVSEQTQKEQAGDAFASHQADRSAEPEEDEAADRSAGEVSEEVSKKVSEHEHEMTRRGASVQGEGQI